MLYTKYESSGPCSFGQEDFWKLHFENLFLTPWPTYATNWNGLNNFDRGPPRDHSCEVSSKSNKRFQRRCCLKNLLTDARTDARTDDGRRTLKDHKSSLSTLCSGELKSPQCTRGGVFSPWGTSARAGCSWDTFVLHPLSPMPLSHGFKAVNGDWMHVM